MAVVGQCRHHPVGLGNLVTELVHAPDQQHQQGNDGGQQGYAHGNDRYGLCVHGVMLLHQRGPAGEGGHRAHTIGCIERRDALISHGTNAYALGVHAKVCVELGWTAATVLTPCRHRRLGVISMSAASEHTTSYFHIIAWRGTHAHAAIQRCFRSRNTATSAVRRGLIGDRSEHHLDTGDGRDYSVAPCRPGCRCGTWPTGHNRERIAQLSISTVMDPATEEPAIYCWKCRLLVVNRLVSRRRPPMPPRTLRPFQRDSERDRAALDEGGFTTIWH